MIEQDDDIKRLVRLRNGLMEQMRALENQVIGMNTALAIVNDEIRKEEALPPDDGASEAAQRREARHYHSNFEPT